MTVRHLLSVADLTREELVHLLDRARTIQRTPRRFRRALEGRVLLTIFQMPSLRTALSFDVAMYSGGGHVIDYAAERSPWAKGKESIEDVARVASRYVDAIMVRMHDHAELAKLAAAAAVPVINGLTSREHPCQVLGDLLTLRARFGRLEGLTLAYVGDALNNVTHSLLLAGALAGLRVRVACPPDPAYAPDPEVLEAARRLAGPRRGPFDVVADPREAVRGARVVYGDSWMSYRIDPALRPRRVHDLSPYRIDAALLEAAAPDAVFMHPLPAIRGEEVTAEVLDGPRSIVLDQAEGRLHAQRAILAFLLGARRR